MKKLDKLILKSFIGPFILTFLVVTFILLTRQMLYYFDDIIGKDLGMMVLGKFLFYFVVLMISSSLPLAVLLASLITFGNLAEHFELTAIKSTGISLPRVLLPIFLFVLLLTGIAFYANNNLVPKTALKAYSLLYDIKQKKPTLDIREGIFYNGLPNVSIKVNQKFPKDQAALKGIILYDHTREDDEDVFVADSGRMFTVLNDRFLKFELYRGYNYKDNPESDLQRRSIDTEALSRSYFNKLEITYDLSSFDLSRTSLELFEGNRLMMNLRQLDNRIDSMNWKMVHHRIEPIPALDGTNPFMQKKSDPSPILLSGINKLFKEGLSSEQIQIATNRAREIKNRLENRREEKEEFRKTLLGYEIQRHKIIANSLACIVMFLIGAPLGAIIRRGGLGVPFLVSIFFFILYTLIGMQGEKLAMQNLVNVEIAAWSANVILLITGLVFLRMAQRDGRLLESDLYTIIWSKFNLRLSTTKSSGC